MSKTAAQTDSMLLRVHLLGAWRIEINGQAIEMRRKPKHLIKLLALQANLRLHREQIVEHLWAAQDYDVAVNNLHKTIHAARRAFEPNLVSGGDSKFILTKEGQIFLTAPDELWIDAAEFEKLAALALTGNADEKCCEAALAVYAGDLLPEDLYEEWTTERRESLRFARRRLLEKLGGIYRENGQLEKSTVIYQKLVAEDELDETAHRNLMKLYALRGNRQAAVKQYEICCRVLKKELVIVPEQETRKLYEQIAAGKFESRANSDEKSFKINQENPLPKQAKPKTNLPLRLTSFIGREKEIADLKNLLEEARLLTLTGTGGIGKTRLAQKIAHELMEKFADGVWFVELAALNDATLGWSAIAGAVAGMSEKAGEAIDETLLEFLRRREMLIVLDNCEHLVDECARMGAKLLENCPHLKILATSREALDAEGEIVWRVSALSLPGELTPHRADENFGQSEAVKLFVERARLNDARFALDENNSTSIAIICRHLDGIPLALELAAARVRVISPEQIAARLDASLQILTGGGRNVALRHQTLRAAIDWSYRLLSETEKSVWRALSAFAGGFTLDAAEFVCANLADENSLTVLDLLTDLTDKSIVSVAENGAETRYTQLETLRQYAAEKLVENAEDKTIRAAHFNYFLELAERAESGFSTPEKRVWLARLEKEIDNLRLALDWAAEKNAAEFLRLANALWHFWQSSGRLAEGRRQFENALGQDENAPADLRAKALHRLGGLLVLECDYAGAAKIYENALDISRAAKERFLTARILANYGFTLVNRGEYARAEKLLNEGLEIFRVLKDENGVAQIFNGLGAAAYYQDDFARASQFFTEALAIYRRTKNQLNVIGVLQNLGSSAHLQNNLYAAEKYLTEALKVAEDLGERRWINQTRHVLGYVYNDLKDYARAARFFRAALNLDPEIGGKDNIAHTLEGFACTAAALENFSRAKRLFAFADRLREEMKTPRGNALQKYFDRYLQAVTTNLTAEEIETINQETLDITDKQMLEFALENQK